MKLNLAALCFLSLACLALAAQILDPAALPGAHTALVDLDAINLPPCSPQHMLGTDSLGRDVLTTAFLGARTSIFVGLTSAFLAVVIGVAWGAAGALVSPALGSLMMRTVDALLAIPSLILLLALSSLIMRPGFLECLPGWMADLLGVSSYSLGLLPVVSIVIVIAATSWLEAARITYAKISTEKLMEYVEAARSLGCSGVHLVFRHLIPNSRRIILIQATLLVSDAIIMEAGLSFLGLGFGPGIPSWGSMLRQAQSDLYFGNWWSPAVPSLLITMTVLAVNMFGEAMLNSPVLSTTSAADRLH